MQNYLRITAKPILVIWIESDCLINTKLRTAGQGIKKIKGTMLKLSDNNPK